MHDINSAVTKYNREVTELLDDGTVRCRAVTLYSPYKKLKIKGLAKPIADEDVTKFSRRYGVETSEVEFTVRVTNPLECDFNYIPS